MPSEESLKKAREITRALRLPDPEVCVLAIDIIATALDERTEECARIADDYDTGGFGEWRNMVTAQTVSREISEAIRALTKGQLSAEGTGDRQSSRRPSLKGYRQWLRD